MFLLVLWPLAWIGIAVYLYKVEKTKSHVIGIGGSFFGSCVLVALLGAGMEIVEGHPDAESGAASPVDACHDDWHKCQDNSMLVNHWKGEMDASIACQHAADDQAKWGHPTFSSVPFPSFRGGKDYVANGQMVLIDKDTAYQNGFGAMERVTAICAYDLKESKVAELDVVPRD